MNHTFQDCIFCSNPLPAECTGQGEHIIPSNICGFWKSHDICGECKQHFGNKIDNSGIENPHLLEAMYTLNLSKAGTYYDNLKYQGYDTETGEKVEMTRKKGGFKAKVIEEGEDFIQHAEGDIEFVGFDWLKKNLKDQMPERLIEKEIEDLKEQYDNCKPGDVVRSETLGYSARKGQVKEVEVDETKIPSITPLIAKIVVCYLKYFIYSQLENIDIYQSLIDHSRNNQPLKDDTINRLTVRDDKVFDKWHRIRMFPEPGLLLIDTTLFANITWRTVLPCSIDESFWNDGDGILEVLFFIIDFREVPYIRMLEKYKDDDKVYRLL